MCDLETYRANIGNFHLSTHKTNPVCLSDLTWKVASNPHLLLCIIITLLLQCGDIESNPGPDNRNEENLSDISSRSSYHSTHQPNNHIHILHINSQSLRKNFDAVESQSIGYDVVCLTETWLNPSIEDSSIKLCGFNPPFRKDRPDGYGGVAIYISEHLAAIPRPDLDVPSLEALWVELRHPKMKALFCCTYRPPKSPVKYWNLIDESIDKARSTDIIHQFILGDLNDDQLTPRSKLNSILTKHNFTQLIKEVTHSTPTSNKCIDIIATTSTNFVTSAGALPQLASKHKPVQATLKIKKPLLKCYNREVWSTKNVDWEKLNTDLANQNWETTLAQPDLNSMLDTWANEYLSVVKNHIKRTNVLIRPSEPKWMTKELRHLLRKRNRLHKIANKKGTPTTWENFRKARNELKDKIRQAKTDHTTRTTEKIQQRNITNPKVWWSLVKEFYQKQASSRNLSKPLNVNGKVISEDTEKANVLNNYFVQQTNIQSNGISPPNLPNTGTSHLNTINIKASTVKDMTEILNTSKSCGPDPISPLLIKKTGKTIAPILAKIFNYSIKSSVFPDKWKLAFVVPIHKKGDESDTKNYRPISLLPCLSKVFERCVFKDIFNYLHKNNRLSKLQAAYSPCNSTEYQLLELYHLISKAMDEDKTVRFVFCDVSKAFDRVWHDGLIVKLKSMGIGGSLLKWFRSYLDNRKQIVVVNGCESRMMNLNAGVPQGSILGPLLFLIYINDICSVVQSNIRLYADDSIIFAIGKDQTEIAANLNADLERITKWAQDWLVTFNPNKTESMLFSRNLTQKPQLLMNNIPILEVDTHKHLGCHLDSNAKWTTHINEIVTKAGRRVDILRGLKYRLDRRSLEILYCSFIRPILEYGQAVWSNCTLAQKESIESIQLSAIHVITGAIKGTSTQKLYNESCFTSTIERRDRHCLTIYYKIYHGHTPSYLRELLPPRRNTSTYALRHKNKLGTIKCKTITYSNTFIPRMTRHWNTLESSITYVGSLPDLKRMLKKDDKRVPQRFYQGDRKWSTILTRMRLGCSPLKHDLFMMRIIQSEDCDCGHHCEDTFHFFFVCPQYTHIRQILNEIHPSVTHTVNNFLFGMNNVNNIINNNLLNTVLKYIRLSNRF